MADVQLSTLGSVIKTAYEQQNNTNAFTDAEKSLLGYLNGFTGWASYIDTQYSDQGTAFTLTANVDTVLPNNAGTVVDAQKPTDVVTFYDPLNRKITGRNGDGLDCMIYFRAMPTSATQHMDIWINIGGSVGQIYRQTFDFPKGVGEERGVLYALPSAYTLNTWQANGGSVYVRSNHDLLIYGINYNFDRSHKAR